jgi:hypothetical protein
MNDLILLRAFSQYYARSTINCQTGRFIRLSLLANIARRKENTYGHFSKLSGRVIKIYKCKQQMHLDIDEERFVLSDCIRSRLNEVDAENDRFQLIENDKVVVEFVRKRPIEADPTMMVSEEDFDFMLFVNNVVNDKRRQQRMYLLE